MGKGKGKSNKCLNFRNIFSGNKTKMFTSETTNNYFQGDTKTENDENLTHKDLESKERLTYYLDNYLQEVDKMKAKFCASGNPATKTVVLSNVIKLAKEQSQFDNRLLYWALQDEKTRNAIISIYFTGYTETRRQKQVVIGVAGKTKTIKEGYDMTNWIYHETGPNAGMLMGTKKDGKSYIISCDYISGDKKCERK